MHVIASFEYSTELEIALAKIEKLGVEKKDIIAIPLEEIAEKKQLIDTLHDSDGSSMLDLGFVLAAVFMLLGAIYGFVLKWGPILWGLIGFISGLLLGIIIKMLFTGVKNIKIKSKTTEVFVVVSCKEEQKLKIKDILFKHSGRGVGFMD
jgi:hypothetical protein